ncbi:MAG TPA: PEGA domain-containing protein, partial [Candidatus Polarisedimenticolaceae bacterium]|nr:PEGA domain-containing protein [Candidatus Polarisedimenticolaceae bacterium]
MKRSWIALAFGSVLLAQAPPPGTAEQRLAAIREELGAARFEQALSAIDAALREPGLSETLRIDAVVLRSEAHAALGDLKATEQDYRAILRGRPGFTPEPSFTPRKALDLFTKLQAELVGTLRLALDPADAEVRVDGSRLAPSADGAWRLVLGEHRVQVAHVGFEPYEKTVLLERAREVALEVALVPNARTLIVRTDPDGVDVVLDGVRAGSTVRSPGSETAELAIEALPAGEHLIELSKPCYRDQRVREILSIDLLDRGPRLLDVARLQPAKALLTVSGGPAGASLEIDGSAAGRLPQDALEVCAGPRELVVRVAGRTVWRSVESVQQGGRQRVEVRPRPNAVLVGSEEWPPSLAALRAEFNTLAGRPLPGGVDLSAAAGWRAVPLPADADLVIAVVPAGHASRSDRVLLYSPALGAVAPVENPAELTGRPRWSA